MEKNAAKQLIKETFQNSFEKDRFYYFLKNLLNNFDDAPFVYRGNFIPDAYDSHIKTLERIGKYQDPEERKIDILVVHLKKEGSLEHARTMQRNFISWYLNGSRGGKRKDAALVAFISPNKKDWRFSLVKMEYKLKKTPTGKVKGEEEFTPAQRFSFIVGQNENTHTAQSRLVSILENDIDRPTLKQLEEAFSVERVTKEFFEKYRDLYLITKETLDDIIEKNSAVERNFTEKNINTVNFSKKLLGQIVFLYFLQRKGWFGVPMNKNWGDGDKRFLRTLFQKCESEGKNYFNDYLEPLFYEALAKERDDNFYSRFECKIPFLNGGLFDPINDYDWVNTDINFANDIFSNKRKTKEGDAGNGILDVFDRYNFTVKEDEPLEREVAIDPEMLGKVFENLLEVKDRKSKGTYYTPREIVHYMCQESLANYLITELKNKVNKKDIDTLIKYGETVVEHETEVESRGKETKTYSYKLPKNIRGNAKFIDEKLNNIRICDPAVGSGAFPVGIMNEIVRTRNALTSYFKAKQDRTIYNFKRHAIQNCLYGVDIDPGAVEIAKLRLWLSLIVDEKDIKQIRPLPNLDYKIVCGNSLLAVEKNLFNQQLFAKLERLKPLYFNETNTKKKQEYKKQIDELINQITNGREDFDFEVYFSEIFHEKKGFDVVIANPPYVSHVNFSKKEKTLLQANFQTFKGRADIYIAFYEQGVRILKDNGYLVYITPNKFFRAGYGEGLRKYLKDNTKIIFIIDFGDSPIFEAITYPSILLLQKTKQPEYKFHFLQAKKPDELFEKGNFRILNNSYLSNDLWTFENEDLLQIWKKIKSSSVNLPEYIGNELYRGIVTGLNEAFIIDEKRKNTLIKKNSLISEIIKPYLKGKNVKRWVSKSDSYIIFTYHGIDISKYPEILDYLKPFKSKLEKRATSKNHKWYELQQPQTGIYQYYEQTKIISTDIAKRCEFTIDNSGSYIDATIFCIPLNDLYLLSLLNSQLIEIYYRNQASTIRGDFLRFKKIYLDLLPIKKIIPKNQKPIINIVNKILTIAKDKDYLDNSDKKTKIREYEKQIDKLVYRLYGLKTEEIKIVESSRR